MLEKGIKYSEEIAQRAISFSLWQFCFRCLSSFGIIDYLYERLSLDMNIYRIAFGILLIVFFYKRNTYYKR
jgi:hypothetical protein